MVDDVVGVHRVDVAVDADVGVDTLDADAVEVELLDAPVDRVDVADDADVGVNALDAEAAAVELLDGVAVELLDAPVDRIGVGAVVGVAKLDTTAVGVAIMEGTGVTTAVAVALCDCVTEGSALEVTVDEAVRVLGSVKTTVGIDEGVDEVVGNIVEATLEGDGTGDVELVVVDTAVGKLVSAAVDVALTLIEDVNVEVDDGVRVVVGDAGPIAHVTPTVMGVPLGSCATGTPTSA